MITDEHDRREGYEGRQVMGRSCNTGLQEKEWMGTDQVGEDNREKVVSYWCDTGYKRRKGMGTEYGDEGL